MEEDQEKRRFAKAVLASSRDNMLLPLLLAAIGWLVLWTWGQIWSISLQVGGAAWIHHGFAKRFMPPFSLTTYQHFALFWCAIWACGFALDYLVKRTPAHITAFAPGVMFVLAMMTQFERCPERVLNAQFWAEDGFVFFSEAYRKGAIAFITPYNGYLHVAPRLVALTSTWLPLRLAPQFFAIVALCVVAATSAFLASNRCNRLGPLSLRIIWAILLVVCPARSEVFANMANAQFFLAIFVVLMVIGDQPTSILYRGIYCGFFAICAFTGPFSPIYWIASMRVLPSQSRYAKVVRSIFAAGSVVQLGLLATSDRPQPGEPVYRGHVLPVLAKAMYDSILGETRYHFLPPTVQVALVVLLIGFGIYAFRGDSYTLKWFWAISGCISLSVLILPTGLVSELPLYGNRYFVPLSFAVLATIAAGAFYRNLRFALLLAPVALVGLISDWSIPPLDDFHWNGQVKEYEEGHRTSFWIPNGRYMVLSNLKQ
jgi:hypothetical protein